MPTTPDTPSTLTLTDPASRTGLREVLGQRTGIPSPADAAVHLAKISGIHPDSALAAPNAGRKAETTMFGY